MLSANALAVPEALKTLLLTRAIPNHSERNRSALVLAVDELAALLGGHDELTDYG